MSDAIHFIANPSTTLATVSPQGEVRIDWRAVENAAAETEDRVELRFYAQLMLAIRDGTWKVLEPQS